MRKGILFLLLAIAGFAVTAHADELLVNGGFEDGLNGWTVTNQFLSLGSFVAASGPSALTPGPSQGNGYAVGVDAVYGTNALTQDFTVPLGADGVTLSFDLFVDIAGKVHRNGHGLNFNPLLGRNDFATVDLLADGANPLGGGKEVLANYYQGADTPFTSNGYTHYSFDISQHIQPGGTYELRFGQVENGELLYAGVDNVSITAVGATPEPASLLLTIPALAGGLFLRRRRVMQ